MNIFILLLASFFPFSLTAYAQDEHHHDEHHAEHHDEHHDDELGFEDHAAHVHGAANGNISYVDNTLKIELNMASKDVFGFEHIPQSENEIETVVRNLHYLEDITNVLTTTPACDTKESMVDSDILPSHNDEHDDSIEHSDVNVVYELACESDIKLKFVLFEQFSSLENISIQYVSPSEQRLLSVTPDNNTITLHK